MSYVPRCVVGTKGDGSDDTPTLQAALDSIKLGGCVFLTPNKTYSVTNLRLPTTGTEGFVTNGLMCVGGTATIRKLPSGDPTYCVASERWADNSTFADGPWHIENIVFDAAGIAAYPFVSKAWTALYRRCVFQGGTASSFLLTRRNKDGTNGTDQFLSDNSFIDCRFLGGFKTEGFASAPSQAPTDGSILNCAVVDGLLDIANTAGWTIANCRTYGESGGGAYFRTLSRGFTCIGNNFDGSAGISLGALAFWNYAKIGPGNSYYTPLIALFSNDTLAQTLLVEGEVFWANANGTVDAYILHSNNRTQKTLVSRNNTFRTTTPHRKSVGNTLGVYRIEGGFDGNGAFV